MPEIVDYAAVLERMRAAGLRSLYHNSGAFGFSEPVEIVGWIGREDPTIRPEMRQLARQIAPPYEKRMAELAVRVWQDRLSGAAWLMPMSHWSFELSDGSREWMPAALDRLGIDTEMLAGRNTADAVEFRPNESRALRDMLHDLLQHLVASDFALIFPGHHLVGTVHHNGQLWWQTPERVLAEILTSVQPGELG